MHRLRTRWPQATRINFDMSRSFDFAETDKVHTTPLPSYLMRFGVMDGLSVSAVAHEATHAALWIMGDVNFETWAPIWQGLDAKDQSEETLCYVIETITHQTVARAEKLGAKIINPIRQNIRD